MLSGMHFWGDKLPNGLVMKKLHDGRIIETFPDMPECLYAFLEQTAGRVPEKTAVEDDLGRILTYSQLKEKVDSFAGYLAGHLGMEQGSHIAIMAYSTAEFMTAFLAVNKIGGVAVILPTKFKQQEIRFLTDRADISLIICDEKYEAWFEENRAAGIPIISYQPDAAEFAFDKYGKMSGYAGETCISGYEDVCVMMFTSGTTSMSKGVLLTNYNFVHAAGVYRAAVDITENDRTVIPVPIYTITALSAVIGTFILVGGTIFLQRTFNATNVLTCIRKHKLTYMHAAPTVCSLLLEEREQFPSLPTLKKIVCGGSRMPAEKIRMLHEWLPGCEYHNVYGMTETCSPATIQRENAIDCPEMASEGFPVPGLHFKITDDDGREVCAGKTGEIMISGTCIMQGYYHLDTKDYQDGWFSTGDIGYFTEDGYLYVTDRKKDMINRGGEKMTCCDVEEALYGISGVAEAVVVGIPDELYGEVPAALVKPEKDNSPDEAGIKEYLRSRIAKYKIPVRIIFTDEIPLSSGGKPDRKLIRKMLAEA